MALLEGCEVDDLDEGHDETRRYKSLSHGPMPVMTDANGMEEAIATAIATAKRWQAEDGDGHANSTCVIASSQQVRDSLTRQFSVAGFATAVIDSNQNLSGDGRCVHFATMHRAKGLEFDRVIVVTPAAYLGDPMETE